MKFISNECKVMTVTKVAVKQGKVTVEFFDNALNQVTVKTEEPPHPDFSSAIIEICDYVKKFLHIEADAYGSVTINAVEFPEAQKAIIKATVKNVYADSEVKIPLDIDHLIDVYCGEVADVFARIEHEASEYVQGKTAQLTLPFPKSAASNSSTTEWTVQGHSSKWTGSTL